MNNSCASHKHDWEYEETYDEGQTVDLVYRCINGDCSFEKVSHFVKRGNSKIREYM